MQQAIEAAGNGDASAVQAVVDRLSPRIESLARHYGRACGLDHNDLFQEAWIAVLEALTYVDCTIGDPRQYLIQRARWRILDVAKAARLRQCASLDDKNGHGPARGFSDEAEARVDVDAFAVTLNDQQRHIVSCLLAGLTWRETGSRLGCTSPNVAYHVRKIREQYRSWSLTYGRARSSRHR